MINRFRGFALLAGLILPGAVLLGPPTDYQWGSAPVIHRPFEVVEWIALAAFFLMILWMYRGFLSRGFLAELLRSTGKKRSGFRRILQSHFRIEHGQELLEWEPGRSRSGRLDLWISCIILAAGILYTGLYYRSAYLGFLLQEHDFINLSAGLSHSWMLITPYVNTGPTGSFLGHHFSPFLILIRPFFWMAERLPEANHGVYLLPLFLAISLGQVLWFLAALQRWKSSWILPLVALCLSLHPAVLRLGLSFHFEAFVLPLAALCVLTYNRRIYWLFLILLFSVKEDISLYASVIFAGLWWQSGGREMLSQRMPGRSNGKNSTARTASALLPDRPDAAIAQDASIRQDATRAPDASIGQDATRTTDTPSGQDAPNRRLLHSLILSGAYFLFALSFQKYLAGPSGVDWSHYWQDVFQFRGTQFRGLLFILLSGGWLALLMPRFRPAFLFILALHFFSQHPWHNSFQSHYTYTMLPLLFLVLGTAFEIRKELLLLAVFLIFVSMIVDRSTPLPLIQSRKVDTSLLQSLPANSCIRTSRHISVRIPLHAHPFPLYRIAGNPASNHDLCIPPAGDNCTGRYLLLESQDTHLLHGCIIQDLRFRHGSEHLNLFQYVSPGSPNTAH